MMIDLFPSLLPFEVDCLLWINQHHSPFLDVFMTLISGFNAWFFVLFGLLCLLFYRKPWQEGALILIFLVLCILIGDRLSSGFAKPFFERFRPTHTEGLMEQLHIVFRYTGHKYGFFSSHATNFFSVATFLSLIVRDKRFALVLFPLVLLVCYSRMYLGAHYLSDILVGAVCGSAIAYLLKFPYSYLRQKFSPVAYLTSKEVLANGLEYCLLTLYLFIPILILYSLAFVKILKNVGYPF